MGAIKTKIGQVALNCSTLQGGVSPIEFSANVIVEMFPDVKAYRKDSDALAYMRLMRILDEVREMAKRRNYSKKALIALVEERILSPLSLDDIKEIIKDSPFYCFPDSLDGAMHFRDISKNPPQLRTNYGEEEYMKNALDIEGLSPQTQVPIKVEPHNKSIQKEMTSLPKKELSALPAILKLKKKYKELERPNEKYYWQWRVKTEDYDEFKALLSAIDFTEQTHEKVRLCAPQLAFYVAEWYKREYDGYNSGGCFEDLGISSSFNQEIWDLSHNAEDRPYRTPDTRINEWLYSLYVQGGFPIKYTKRSSKFSPLFDAIWGDEQNRDSISEEQLVEITIGFDGNQVVKNSLISGSLYEYYRYLRIQETMPIAESDLEKEPFSDFIRNLQEGKKKYFEQYLKPIWYIYLDPRDEIIDGEVRVYFGRKDDKCYIPYECLRYWNIPEYDRIDSFEIVVSERFSGVSKSVRFSKTGPGNYPFVGWSMRNVITLPLIPDKASVIDITLETESGQYEVGESFQVGQCLQLYKTRNPYEWSTKTDNSTYTAILFNPVKMTLSENTFSPELKYFEAGGQAWQWLVLTEEVSLVNESGERFSYSPRNSSLELSFKVIPNTIKYVNFRDVVYSHYLDDELVQTTVPLYRKDGLSVLYTPYGSNNSEILMPGTYRVLLKRPGDNSFTLWDKEEKVEQGIMQLRVVYPEKGVSATKLVYYLPDVNPIQRFPKTGKIRFGGYLHSIFAPTKEGYVELERGPEGYVYNDDVISGYDTHSDTIPFRIGGAEEEYIVVNVFRSMICKELYLKTQEEPIKRYEQSGGIVEIPIVLRNNFEVRSISEKGITRSKCGEDIYIRFDFNIKNSSPSSHNSFTDIENELRYYVVTGRRVPGGELGQFQLETGPEQYRFYYWSMSVGEDPVLLDQSFEPETKILTVDMGPLKKNNNGIVFQSLKGVSPRHYIQPVYGNRIPRTYSGYKARCFEVASEHEIPYVVFPCLSEIFTGSDPVFFLSRFWAELMKGYNWKPMPHVYKSLQRFSYEFLFDWILIPKRVWKKMFKDEDDPSIHIGNPNCKEIMTRLFRTNPYVKKDEREYVEKVLDIYWETPSFSIWDFRRSAKLENVFLQCLRGKEGDWSFLCQDFDRRVELLREFHKCGSLYEKVYGLMINLKRN